MKQPLFYGCATALVTPFFPHGEIDFETLGHLIDFQISEGADALVACGTTGESATMTERERLAVIEYTVWKTAGRIPVLAGTGTNCTAQSISITRRAEALGADGILAVCPYYNKPTAEGIAAHYTALADCSSLPVLLYNVPGRTVCEIPMSALKTLSRHPNVLGLKQANGSAASVVRILGECGEDLPLYSGDDGLILPFMALGGVGVISVASNLLPRRIHNLCYNILQGNLREAAAEQIALMPLIDALFSVTNPIPVKAALEALGIPPQGLRLPLLPLTEEEKKPLHRLVKGYLEQ